MSDRRDRPTILLVPDGVMPPEVVARLLQISREREWTVLDVRYRHGVWPPDLDPDGAFVFVPHGEQLERLMKQGCPTVRIGRAPHPNDAQVPAAVPDLPAAGRMAARHFAERSFRHVGFVGFGAVQEDPIAGSLYEGFRTCAIGLGLAAHLYAFEPGRSSESERYDQLYKRRGKLFAEWVRQAPKPMGLLTGSDGMAATLCCMCEDAGIAVPRDVAILGLGNDVLACACTKPPLSSIALDRVAQADAAALLLQQRMEGESIDQPTVMIPPLGVVARESTNTIGTADRDVRAAVRYMEDHLAVDLAVADVARAIGVARRTLERTFSRELGHGVHEALRRARLRELCRLLRVTDDPILDLAPRVGFISPEHLHRVFRRVYGISPRRYRLREQARHRDG